MDANKDLRLQEINYKLHRTCGLCVYFEGSKGSMFGVCKKNTYNHLKHTGDARALSVNIYGSCLDFDWDTVKLPQLHGFQKYIDPPASSTP